MAVSTLAPPILTESQLAKDALKYALIGIFCFGIVLEPIAISRALQAKKAMDMDPTIGGRGKANAALAIGCVALAFWVLGFISRFSNLK